MTGPKLLEGVDGKEGGDVFQGSCSFNIKNLKKSEIFNDKKKIINENFFLWKILTKNLVTFKRWDGIKDKNFNIMEVH